MLRMGKNPSEEKSPTQTQPGPDYANRNYSSPYQSDEYRPTESAATPKAFSESDYRKIIGSL